MKNLLVFVAFATCLAACGEDTEPVSDALDAALEQDAGFTDSGSMDATAGDDAGEAVDASEATDASGEGDAGMDSDAGLSDSGAAQVDAARRDSGVSPRDTGVSPRDSGAPSRDTGVSPRDTGVSPRDTGVVVRDTGRPDAGQEPDVACVAYNTLRTRCAGCHGRAGGFSLGNGSPAAIRAAVLAASNQARGMDYVEPGDTANSYLWHKISGTQRAAGGSGGRMPPGAGLSGTQRNQIEAWINAGAPAARCP
jgi:hypothetical protein